MSAASASDPTFETRTCQLEKCARADVLACVLLASSSVKAALVALLLALGGQVPGDAAVGDGIRQATVGPAAIIGAWRGRWSADGSPGGVIDVDFAAGPRPHTLLGYFTFVVDGASRSERRLGNIDGSAAHFPLLEGGSIVLALEPDGRLVGRFDRPGTGGTPAPPGLLELARLRR